MTDPIRVYLVDDELMVRAAFRSLLSGLPEFEVAGDSGDARQAIQEIGELRPDVVLLDISMPGLSGLDAIAGILRVHPRARILMLTHQKGERFVIQALRSGAMGYLSKDSDPKELALAIEAVQRGERYLSPLVSSGLIDRALGDERVTVPASRLDGLTPREREVFQLLVIGHSNKEVAADLGMSLATAKKHRENLQRKLDCRSPAELTRLAIREGLLRD